LVPWAHLGQDLFLKDARLDQLGYEGSAFRVLRPEEVFHPHPVPEGYDLRLAQLHAVGPAVHELVGAGGGIVAELQHILPHAVAHAAPLGVGKPGFPRGSIVDRYFRGLGVDVQGQMLIFRAQAESFRHLGAGLGRQNQ